MYKLKKIEKGRYKYRGYLIQYFGYYHPEKRVCWEGINTNGDGVACGFTKKEVIREIDYILDKK